MRRIVPTVDLDDPFRCTCERVAEPRICAARATQEDMLCDACRHSAQHPELPHVGVLALGQARPHITTDGQPAMPLWKAALIHGEDSDATQDFAGARLSSWAAGG